MYGPSPTMVLIESLSEDELARLLVTLRDHEWRRQAEMVLDDLSLEANRRYRAANPHVFRQQETHS